MEEIRSLRRTQSLKNISPGHVRSWTETGLLERKKSVSQLVAQYQTSLKARTTSQAETQEVTTDGGLPQKESTPSVKEETQTTLEVLLKRNDLRKLQWERAPHGEDVKLSRSRSVENLPIHRPGSISALRALFESKAAFQQEFKCSQKTGNASISDKTKVTTTVNGNVEREASAEVSKTKSVPTTVDKVQEEVGQKDVNKVLPERRRTISGIPLENFRVQQDEKRRSLIDHKDINSIYGQEKSSSSVKALSALYLSKLAAVDSKGSSIKPDCAPQDHKDSSVKKKKASKFQTPAKELCSACSKPVYPMEKTVADKFIFHNNCFCCKHCKKKLSNCSEQEETMMKDSAINSTRTAGFRGPQRRSATVRKTKKNLSYYPIGTQISLLHVPLPRLCLLKIIQVIKISSIILLRSSNVKIQATLQTLDKVNHTYAATE